MIVTPIDVEIDSERHDLMEQTVFEDLLGRVKSGEFSALLLSPPCSTFSKARCNPVAGSRGPVPLRGEFAPEIYGLPNLPEWDRKKVVTGTGVALRCNELATSATTLDIPNISETPGMTDGFPSVAKLPEVMAHRQLSHHQTHRAVGSGELLLLAFDM